MHLLMLLVKLPVLSLELLTILSVETIKVTKVKLRHVEAFKRTVKTERRASWEVFTSSAVEEK